MKTIIYIGDFTFPYGNAGTQLVKSNAKSLQDLGYNVVFIGNTISDKMIEEIEIPEIHSGYEFYSIPFKKSIKDLFFQRRYNKSVQNILEKYKEDLNCIICYGSPTFSFMINNVRKWTRKYNISFVANVVDISALSHGSIIERIIKFIDRTILRTNYKYGTDGLIAVSSYIAKYFEYRQKGIVILPPLVDTYKIVKRSNKKTEKINLLYAGIPFPVDGRKVDVSSYKDRLDVTIELLSEVYKINKNFVLNIYGLTSDEYLGVITKHTKLVNEMSDVICFHGKTAHDEIIKLVSHADFTINLRDINRMTTAGFSTKFVESISCGTPVITTQTSDLANYLIEGKNGYFININNTEEAVNKLISILLSTKEDIGVMKDYSYDSKLFDYRNYKDKMNEFLVSLNN